MTDWNDRAETAEQRKIDDYDRDRLLSLDESLAIEITRRCAFVLSPEWCEEQADVFACLAKDTADAALRSKYGAVAAMFSEGARYHQQVRRSA